MAENNFSRLRQSLRNLYNPNPSDLGIFLSDYPLIRGTLYTLATRCGKKNCRCVAGARHEALVLTVKIAGKTKMRKPAPGEVDEIRREVERYRQFRRARAEFAKRQRKHLRDMLRLIDAIARQRMRMP